MSDYEVQFLQLVAMFQMAAMQQMGKIANPVTNEIERDLSQAKASIDVLEMLKEKTHGNLSEAEEQYLSKVLFELQMNYVDESKRSPDAGSPGGEPEGDDGVGDDDADDANTAGAEGPESGEEKGGGKDA